MKPIGGFFELEDEGKEGEEFHTGTLILSTGRASFNLILSRLKPKKIFLPFYTCDALTEPVLWNKIPYEFFAIGKDLEPREEISPGKNEYIVLVNYFGIKSQSIKKLSDRYKNRAIIDNTQAFFQKKYSDGFSFNSARKFFGVPDGSYLYSPIDLKVRLKENKNISISHMVHRREGKLDIAYKEFTEYERSLTPQILGCSAYSKNILSKINYIRVIQRRRSNFQFIQSHLEERNSLKISLGPDDVPYCYPFLPENSCNKNIFYRQQIFIPTIWKDVMERRTEGFEFEKDFSGRLLPLQVDQRYDEKDLIRVVNAVKSVFHYD
jgi:hypothetical protein